MNFPAGEFRADPEVQGWLSHAEWVVERITTSKYFLTKIYDIDNLTIYTIWVCASDVRTFMVQPDTKKLRNYGTFKLRNCRSFIVYELMLGYPTFAFLCFDNFGHAMVGIFVGHFLVNYCRRA